MLEILLVRALGRFTPMSRAAGRGLSVPGSASWSTVWTHVTVTVAVVVSRWASGSEPMAAGATARAGPARAGPAFKLGTVADAGVGFSAGGTILVVRPPAATGTVTGKSQLEVETKRTPAREEPRSLGPGGHWQIERRPGPNCRRPIGRLRLGRLGHWRVLRVLA